MAALTLLASWTRPVTTTIAHLPLLLVILLSAPALLVCPFLPKTWCSSGHARLRELRDWHRDILDRLVSSGATTR
jgi:hypothetical protein